MNDETFEATSYPLSWPIGWPRNAKRGDARFKPHSILEATRAVFAELERMGVRDWSVVISTNIELRRDGLPYSNRREPDDPGVAVYFRRGGKPYVLACDRWRSVGANLWAIAKHIEALRGQERWGVGSLDQAFQGYAALPERSRAPGWWDVLGVPRDASRDDARHAFRTLAMRVHPDRGGDAAAFARLNEAWTQAAAEINSRTPTP